VFNYILYRIGQFIALHLPLNLAYRIAIIISDLHYIFAYKDRKAVGENLKAIFPKKSDGEICSIRIRVFRNFAKYLVDFSVFQNRYGLCQKKCAFRKYPVFQPRPI